MKITIEHEGQVIVLTEDHIDPGNLSIQMPRDYEETPCPDGCGCPHRVFSDGGSLSIMAKLVKIPLWGDAV